MSEGLTITLKYEVSYKLDSDGIIVNVTLNGVAQPILKYMIEPTLENIEKLNEEQEKILLHTRDLVYKKFCSSYTPRVIHE